MTRVCLRTRSAVTEAYFAALLFDTAELLCLGERDPIPPCALLLTDLDTADLPRHIPSGCRHLTVGSDGTPDILRPITDRELLDALFPRQIDADAPHLLDSPPRLAVSGAEIHLSKIEHRLLSALLCQKPVPYAELIFSGWGEKGADENILRVTVSNLRKKLAPYRVDIRAQGGAYTCCIPSGG